jgi:cytochrome c oxidase subunit II
VRRRLVAFSLLPVAALGFAGSALASNGGISPVGPESPNAVRITQAFWVILAVTGIIFLIVETVLVVFIIRFRRRGRPREAEGPQIHGATKLEVIWTVIPVLILAGIVSFIFYKLPGIKDAPANAGDQLNVKVEAHQFYWLFTYPDGHQSINVLRVPVDRVVTLDLTSADVIHSWWVPALGGKTDTIPGRTNHTWFQAEHVGSYPIRCAEFCGIQHAAMHGFVQVTQGGAQPPSSEELGKQVVQGVCATCHGFRLEGLIGPAIATNPTLSDPKALETLVRHGFGKMPAVGKTWDDQLMKATTDYLKAHYGAGGGGSGGGGTSGG